MDVSILSILLWHEFGNHVGIGNHVELAKRDYFISVTITELALDSMLR